MLFIVDLGSGFFVFNVVKKTPEAIREFVGPLRRVVFRRGRGAASGFGGLRAGGAAGVAVITRAPFAGSFGGGSAGADRPAPDALAADRGDPGCTQAAMAAGAPTHTGSNGCRSTHTPLP